MKKTGKHIVLITISALLCSLIKAQTPSSVISFEERVFNFGTILEKDGKVSHTFVFRNNGKSPVTINEVFSACSCVGKLLTKGPIRPGEKGKLTITFDPQYKSGFFSKEIMVFSNNGSEYNRVWVEGKIEPMEHPVEEDYPYNFGNGLYLRLKVVAFGYLKPGEARKMELHYANATDKEMTLDFKLGANQKGLRMESPGRIAPKGKGVIAISFTMPPISNQDVHFDLYPYVNGKKLSQPVQVRILNELNKYQKARPGQR